MWDPLQHIREKSKLDTEIARAKLVAILKEEEWIDKFIERISRENKVNKL